LLHKQVEASTEATTDEGRFVALASTYSTDRGGDRVQPGAFADTIRRWKASGRMLPLHWDHAGQPEDIVGYVNPVSMKETADGLRIEAQLDLEESNKAREIWRLVRANSVGLSFGYLVTNERQGADGVRELHDIDLFEVSLTPAPMNPDARILSWKAVTDRDVAAIKAVWDDNRHLLGTSKPARTKSSKPITVKRFEC
jgi:hypothetical protein